MMKQDFVQIEWILLASTTLPSLCQHSREFNFTSWQFCRDLHTTFFSGWWFEISFETYNPQEGNKDSEPQKYDCVENVVVFSFSIISVALSFSGLLRAYKKDQAHAR